MCHNIVTNEINTNFEEPNHIVAFQLVKVFFIKFVCKPNISRTKIGRKPHFSLSYGIRIE